MKHTKWCLRVLVIGLLGLMAVLALLSVRDDSATNDEIAHIAAGYSYLTQQDYRLNPEHPPLVKDLAAFPLLFMNLKFPWDNPDWTEGINKQWELGSLFLYHLGNDADAILFWSRVPMVLFLMALGGMLFYWTRRLLGMPAAMFVLILFVFSPSFLAHGSLVTTDVAAALGVVLALYWFLQFLYNPSRKNTVIAGGVLAFALLVKFSTFVLLPVFGLLFFLYWQFLPASHPSRQHFFLYLKRGAGLMLVATMLLGVVYQLHILNYPAERQLRDSKGILGFYLGIPAENVSFSIATVPVIRPYAHYLLGLARTALRVNLVSIDYFLGETGPTGWRHYFPVLYATKIPLAFHILSLAAIAGGILALRVYKKNSRFSVSVWIHEHFSLIAMGIFVTVYGVLALGSAIQIGFRHLLPVMPFLYILVAAGIRSLVHNFSYPSLIKVVIVALLSWYTVSSITAFPHYLSYYNELAGGIANGYKIAGQSNYDWGQDLKRLAQWVEKQEIETVYLDFFGRAEPSYYLGSKYISWHGSSWWELHGLQSENPEDFPRGNYLAVSSTFLASGRWTSEDYSRARDYDWLQAYTPVARVGPSIFVYYIDIN